MSFQIRKKSNLTWLHVDSVLGSFIVSKFYASLDDNSFQVVEEGTSRRKKYAVSDVVVYDDTSLGVAETFTNITDLSLRLEELLYPAFDYSNHPPVSGIDTTASHHKGKYNATTNTPALINGVGQNGDYYKVSVGGTQDFGNGNIVMKPNDILHYFADDGFWDLLVNNNQNTSGGISVTKTQLTYTTSGIFTIPQNKQIISVIVGELRELNASKYTYNSAGATNNFEITDTAFLAELESGTEIEITTI